MPKEETKKVESICHDMIITRTRKTQKCPSCFGQGKSSCPHARMICSTLNIKQRSYPILPSWFKREFDKLEPNMTLADLKNEMKLKCSICKDIELSYERDGLKSFLASDDCVIVMIQYFENQRGRDPTFQPTFYISERIIIE